MAFDENGTARVLEIEDDGPVRIIRLNRPQQLNAFDDELHLQFGQLWQSVEQDPDVRAVVLTGNGRAFSAGGNLDDFELHHRDFAVRRRILRSARRLVDEMLNVHVPVVAAVNGPAVGLGATLMTLCDIVFIADDTFVADPHVASALVAGDGGAITWPALTSLLKVKQYLLTGDRIPAAEAVAMGLANFAVPKDELLAAATAFAHRLAGLPPQAVQDTKVLLNQTLRPERGEHARPRAGSGEPVTRHGGVRGGPGADAQGQLMDFQFTPAEERFREELRDWLSDHLVGEFAKHPGVGGPADDSHWELRLEWEKLLAADRWLNISWPVEYGGRGGTLNEEIISYLEFATARAPYWVGIQGRDLLGPTLLHFGTSEQKARFLPPITRGRGVLEPGVQRTRRGQRPRLADDPRRARRLRLGDQRPEDLEHLRIARRLDLRAVSHRPHRSPQGHQHAAGAA